MEDEPECGSEPRPRSCKSCIKRGVCEPRFAMARFVVVHAPQFECGIFGCAAVAEWEVFLGSRCREFKDEDESTTAS